MRDKFGSTDIIDCRFIMPVARNLQKEIKNIWKSWTELPKSYFHAWIQPKYGHISMKYDLRAHVKYFFVPSFVSIGKIPIIRSKRANPAYEYCEYCGIFVSTSKYSKARSGQGEAGLKKSSRGKLFLNAGQRFGVFYCLYECESRRLTYWMHAYPLLGFDKWCLLVLETAISRAKQTCIQNRRV